MIKPTSVGAMFTLGAFMLGAMVGGAVAWELVRLPRGLPTDRDVTGIGGVFFKVDDPDESRAWYRQHLGLDGAASINFLWREWYDPADVSFTVWALFPRETDYFGASEQDFMINYRVRDLDALLTKLKAQGVQQAGVLEEYSYGRFAWIIDGDGHRVELWEPVQDSAEESELRLRAETNATPADDPRNER